MKNTLFFAGAPGSRWSGVAQQLGQMPFVNHSDEVAGRRFEHSNFSGHRGSYFGPGMELGNNFDQLTKLRPLEIKAEVDRAFSDNDPAKLRIVKGHIFSYYLDTLRRVFPDAWTMVVWRDDATCLKWWLEIGGFSIPYPRYEWYVDEPTMKLKIAEENRHIRSFVDRNRLTLELFTPAWVEKNFGASVAFDANAYFSDVYVALIK